MRQAEIERNTFETKIKLSLNLDAQEPVEIGTGVGFFDHMLTLFARHSRISLVVKADGDLHVDSHHTVEDVGIVLGQALKKKPLLIRLVSIVMVQLLFPWMKRLVWQVLIYQGVATLFLIVSLIIQNLAILIQNWLKNFSKPWHLMFK